MIETDKISELICKHKISPTQVYILWLLYTEDSVNIKKYIQVFGNFQRKDIEQLEEKGLLLWTNREATSFRTTDLTVMLEFAEAVMVNPDEAYDELFQVYPSWLRINDKKVPAKGLQFQDEKAAREFYKNLISKNKYLHQRILVAVNKDKEANDGYARVKIDKFLTGRLWESIEEEKDSGTAKPSYY